MPKAAEGNIVQLIKLTERIKHDRFYFHTMVMFKAFPRPTPKQAIEILGKKPGGALVVAELQKRGKLKGMTPNPGTLIGQCGPTSGDPWNAGNAEIYGPSPQYVLFCCSDGPNGWWESDFQMPVKDDMMAMVQVNGGAGTVEVDLDGVTAGTYAFSGNDWIVVVAADIAAGSHRLRLTQAGGFFYWLGTYYYQL